MPGRRIDGLEPFTLPDLTFIPRRTGRMQRPWCLSCDEPVDWWTLSHNGGPQHQPILTLAHHGQRFTIIPPTFEDGEAFLKEFEERFLSGNERLEYAMVGER